ncbi:MAG: DUF5004 domain-containing protein [Fimbriimonadaceae bacterium]
MVSLIVILAALPAQDAKLEQFLVGTWRLNPNTVTFVPSAVGRAYEATRKKGVIAEQFRKEAAKNTDVKYTFLKDHSYAVNHKDYRINAKGRITTKGTWKLRGNDVVVTMSNKPPFPAVFRISRDMKELQLHQVAGDNGTLTIGMLRVRNG